MINFLTQYGPILDFRSLIFQWQGAGIFDIVLPFLLIFAVVYAILEKGHILGENKAVHVIIALVLGFFAVSNTLLTPFFAFLFANAALGFAVVIVAILFLGFFVRGDDADGWYKWTGVVIGGLIFFWVLGRSINDSGMQDIVWEFFYTNPGLWSAIAYGVPIALVILGVVLSSNTPRPPRAGRAGGGDGGH